MKSIKCNKIKLIMVKIHLFRMDFGAAQKIMLIKRSQLKIFRNLMLGLIAIQVMLFFCSNSCIGILQTSCI